MRRHRSRIISCLGAGYDEIMGCEVVKLGYVERSEEGEISTRTRQAKKHERDIESGQDVASKKSRKEDVPIRGR